MKIFELDIIHFIYCKYAQNILEYYRNSSAIEFDFGAIQFTLFRLPNLRVIFVFFEKNPLQVGSFLYIGHIL